MSLRLEEIAFDERTRSGENATARLRRAFEATSNALRAAYSRVQGIRHNTPPTSPATAAALPTASAKLWGQMYVLDKNGAADDTVHVCIRNAAGNYVWKAYTLV